MSHVLDLRREVTRIVASHTVPAAPTLLVRRALPDAGLRGVGPWIFLEHFGPLLVAPGAAEAPAQAHAGIQTVTYLLEGAMRHRDAAGHAGEISRYGAQWLTAGRGVVHAERPTGGAGGMLHGLQLWTKLPRARQLDAPAYQRFAAESLPVFRAGEALVRVVGGALMGRRSPALAPWPLVLAHVCFAGRGGAELEVPRGFELAAYVVAGQACFGEVEADAGKLLRFSPEGRSLELANDQDEPAEIVLLGGAPFTEPMLFRGGFVMDSAAALQRAEQDHRAGRMGALAR
jgi:redox-sensitive bicupin YhaK (pirin superfamily)